MSGKSLSLTAGTFGKAGEAPISRPGNTGLPVQALGFCPFLWPSASLHPFTSYTPMCQGQWPLTSWSTRWGWTGRDKERVNILRWGCRWGWCERPDSGELWSLGGGRDEDVFGHVRDSSGVIQLLEHRGQSISPTSGAGVHLQARREEGGYPSGPTSVPRVSGH